MGDAAKGIRAFQDGLKSDGEGDKPAAAPTVLPPTDAARDPSKDTAKS